MVTDSRNGVQDYPSWGRPMGAEDDRLYRSDAHLAPAFSRLIVPMAAPACLEGVWHPITAPQRS
jgi:hypothetical protein